MTVEVLAVLFKAYGYTFRGSNPVIFIFASLLKCGLLLKERILSFKSKPHLGRAMSAKKANRQSQKLFPLVKWWCWLYVRAMHGGVETMA